MNRETNLRLELNIPIEQNPNRITLNLFQNCTLNGVMHIFKRVTKFIKIFIILIDKRIASGHNICSTSYIESNSYYNCFSFLNITHRLLNK